MLGQAWREGGAAFMQMLRRAKMERRPRRSSDGDGWKATAEFRWELHRLRNPILKKGNQI